jgi:hypothetical protein
MCSDAARSAEDDATESQKPSELVTASTESSTTTFSFGSASSIGSNMNAGFTFGRYAPNVGIDKPRVEVWILK